MMLCIATLETEAWRDLKVSNEGRAAAVVAAFETSK